MRGDNPVRRSRLRRQLGELNRIWGPRSTLDVVVVVVGDGDVAVGGAPWPLELRPSAPARLFGELGGFAQLVEALSRPRHPRRLLHSAPPPEQVVRGDGRRGEGRDGRLPGGRFQAQRGSESVKAQTYRRRISGWPSIPGERAIASARGAKGTSEP
jgi:hypothetical protein